MDFSKIKTKLDSCDYLTTEEFSKDLKLVFSNAMVFNAPASEVYLAAEKMDNKASALLKDKLFPDNN